ncbi:MAG: acetate--CoA ligase family protein [Candidatus Abyssubacteria bacterium]
MNPKNDLDRFFNPRHIAIVGVPRTDDRFGGGSFLRKFLECGYQGKLYPINPNAEELQGLKAYPNLAALPEVPDKAIVSVPAKRVPDVLHECARIGLRRIHILSSGFKETATEEGRRLEEHITAIAREKGLLVIGPNCMGAYCPASRLTAWGAIPGMSGPLGIISQSGGITQRLTEYTYSLGVGVEKAVSFGNAAALDSTDFLEFMARDEKIELIAMYLESVKDGRKFLNLAKQVSRQKPIIVWKGGLTPVGASTAASHTGTLAGTRETWEAFFRQTGVIQVGSMDEWADAIITMCFLPPPGGTAAFLIGGGGGNSVGNGDICVMEGLEVPRLSEATLRTLRETVPLAGSIAGNPLDMWRTFEDPDYLLEVLEVAYNEPNVDILIVDRMIPRKAFHMPDRENLTPRIIDFVQNNRHRKPTVFTADSEGGDADLAAKGAALRAQFCRAGIPAYPTTRRAARALARYYRYHAWKKQGQTENQ